MTSLFPPDHPWAASLDVRRHAHCFKIIPRFSETASFVTSGPVIEQRLEATLRRLRTDYIDVFSLHSVTPAQYAAAADRLLASLMKLREQGKVRAIGITEAYKQDPEYGCSRAPLPAAGST